MSKDTQSAAYDFRHPPKKEPKVLKHLLIPVAGELKGRSIEHHYTGYDHPAETAHFDDNQGEEMLLHVAKHANIKPSSESERDEEEEENLSPGIHARVKKDEAKEDAKK